MYKQATLWLSLVVGLPVAFAQGPAKDPDTLARQILAALTANDQKALETMGVNGAEFKKYIWPTLASRVAGGQMNAEKFYAMYSKSSELGLTGHLARCGGQKLELVKVSTGPEQKFKGYRLWPNPEITVRGEGGQEQVLKLGSALLEHDGSLKVASYYRAPTGSAKQ